jgi:hypothetical protein
MKRMRGVPTMSDPDYLLDCLTDDLPAYLEAKRKWDSVDRSGRSWEEDEAERNDLQYHRDQVVSRIRALVKSFIVGGLG